VLHIYIYMTLVT